MRKRLSLIRQLEKKRNSRVITLIHRQGFFSFLTIPIARYIDIEDAESILLAIRLTPPEMPIDLIIHTPGGLVLAAEQIAYALNRHPGKVSVFIPHYAMSGGTMIALSADEIYMDRNSVVGSVDPLLPDAKGNFIPAVSVVEALKVANLNRNDYILVLGCTAKKAISQLYESLFFLLTKNYNEDISKKVAAELTEGKWTHDYPLTYEYIKSIGINVNEILPYEVYDIISSFENPRKRNPSVEFVSSRYKSKIITVVNLGEQ